MRLFGLLIVLFLSASCVSATYGETDQQTQFALAAIQDNILTTDYTALVKIIRTTTEEIVENKTARNDEDLVAIKYTAKVLECYIGGEQKHIEFTEYIEKSEGLEDLSEGILIVSLCKDRGGKYYLPDIGYELPAQKVIIEKAKETKALIKAKKLSLRRDDDNYACGQNH